MSINLKFPFGYQILVRTLVWSITCVEQGFLNVVEVQVDQLLEINFNVSTSDDKHISSELKRTL